MNLSFIKKSFIVVSAFTLVTVAGCKKSDFAINDNPYELTETTIDFKTVLPSALSATATSVATDWTVFQKWMGFWARSGSFQNIADEESYNFTNDFAVNIWNNLYRNISTYDVVQQKAAAANAGVYEGIARIMKAHNFGLLVDVYGNIPYTDALKGLNNLTPKYDKGIDIYKDLFRQIDTAIVLMKDPVKGSTANNENIAKNDLAFAGNKTSWIKTANTIKLRLLVHASQVAGFPIASEMAIINATGVGYLGAGENLQVNPGYSASKPNPYYRLYITNENGTNGTFSQSVRANAYAIGDGSSGGYYGYNGDPRVNKFYTGGGLGLRGLPYGFVAGTAPDYETGNTASINASGLVPTGATSRAWILTSVESLFLQAEAKERNIIPGGPGTALVETRAAITESFVWLGLTAIQASSYYTGGNTGYVDVDYGSVGTAPPGNTPSTSYPQVVGSTVPKGVYTILSQKWFALNGIAPFEIWTDFRRSDLKYGVETGFAQGPPLSIYPGRTVNKLPIRLFYPQNEFNFNAANVAQQGTINVFTSKVFWDIN
jgi:Starch-binding associating with outer membrane